MSLPPFFEHSFDSSSFVCRFPGIFITLKGKLPPELIDTQVPLKVSVLLPEPYCSFPQPVVKPLSNSSTPRDFMQSEEREEKVDENEECHCVNGRRK
ncbi:hypothetical protein PQX77_019624 [Marasmius sp. AFHP31]|nr:hypothetical protein PQX77_019624 [Marasmius sp. AFHP31]